MKKQRKTRKNQDKNKEKLGKTEKKQRKTRKN